MSDLDALDERLRAVERALTDGDDDLSDLRNAAELARELGGVGDRLDEAEARLDELEASTQALRGYVGNVRAVNESVERRADAALAKAESLEAQSTDPAESDGDSASSTRRTDASDRGHTPPVTATDPDPPVTCGCRDRGSGSGRDSEDRADSDEPRSDDRPGLLARIAEAL